MLNQKDLARFAGLHCARSSHGSAVRAATLFLVTFLAAVSYGGTWSYSWSGASGAPNLKISGATTSSYSFNTNSHVRGTNATVQGPVQVHCTYTPSAGELPVLATVYKIHIVASWSEGVSGSANDGFGDAEVNGTSSGPNGYGLPGYTLVTSTPTSFTTTAWSPTASSAPGIVGSELTPGLAGITCTISCYPIQMPLGGSTQLSPGTWSILTGQQLSASVNKNGLGTNPSSADTFTWSTPSAGNPFGNYQPSAAGAQQSPFSLPPTTQNLLPCYFAIPGTPQIACTYYSGAAQASMSLSEPLNVVVPSFGPILQAIGSVQTAIVVNTGNPPAISSVTPTNSISANEMLLWGAVNTYDNNQQAGIWSVDNVFDPMGFAGYGQWGHVQVLDPFSGYTKINGQLTDSLGPITTLDGFPPGVPAGRLFPYDGFYTAASPAIGTFDDTPGAGIGPGSMTQTEEDNFNGKFDLYIFYKPAVAPGGTTSVFVPLSLSTWTAGGTCSFPYQGTNVWSPVSGSKPTFPAPSSYPAFPHW